MRNETRLLSVVLGLLPIALLVAGNVFIFGPFAVYSGNSAEFEIGLLLLLSISVVAGLVLTALLVVIGVLIPDRYSSVFSAALMAIGILLWVQGSFLIREFGVFDGRGSIDWVEAWRGGLANLALWCGVIAASCVLHRRLGNISSLVCWLMIILQTALLVGLGASSSKKLWVKEYVPSDRIPPEILKYSSVRNVVHFVFDSFQTDVFQELVAEQDLEDEFNGFVLFAENMGVSPYTSLSIPAVFSGRVFDGIDSPGSYYKKSIKSGFQNQLFNAGFVVNLIPEMPMRIGEYTHYYEIPSAHAASRMGLAAANWALLVDVSLFRQVPYAVQKDLYNNGIWFISRLVQGQGNIPYLGQRKFFDHYQRSIEIGDDGPAYHFLHLMPPHPPYVINPDGSYAAGVLPNTRENYISQARSILNQLVAYLEKLRSLGLYDSSIIIVHGDHGSQILPVVDGETAETFLPRVAPFLAVKPAGRTAPFSISYAPTSLLDIPATVLDLTGLEASFPGESVFEIDDDLNRPRPFIAYEGNEDPPRLTNYVVLGSVFERASWQELGRTKVSNTSPAYNYGDLVSFGMEGNSDPYLGYGWGVPMGNFCWSNGHRSSLKFLVKPAELDVRLSVRFIPAVYPGILPEQLVIVSVDDRVVGEWVANEKKISEFETIIPKSLITSSSLQVTFGLPNAASPRKIGTGGDARTLGIAMVSLKMELTNNGPEDDTALTDFQQLPGYLYGTSVLFGSGGNSDSILGKGWSDSTEHGFCWNDGHRATARISASPPERDLVLDSTFIPFLVEGKVPVQRVRVSVNGEVVANWAVISKGTQEFRAVIPRRLVESGAIELVFDLPDAISPASIGAGEDTRTLAIAMRAMRITQSATPHSAR